MRPSMTKHIVLCTISNMFKIMNFIGKVVKIEEAESSESRYIYWVNTSSCKSSYLVRARNVAEFQENYQAEVLQWLNDNGYPEPLMIPQSAECEYTPAADDSDE